MTDPTPTDTTRVIFGGADTHRDTIHLAIVDTLGRALADTEVPTTPTGYARAVRFLHAHGHPTAVGVEGTGSYGAGLTQHLTSAGITVIEVDRPDRATRRRHGKSDPIDAYAAAQATAAGRATTIPKTRTGAVESIRVLRIARAGAVKARTQTINQLKAILITAPTPLREHLAPHHTTTALIAACTRLRLHHTTTDLTDPTTATKTALRTLARRYHTLTTEITDLDTMLNPLIAATAPNLLAIPGVGPDVAGQLLVTAGDNPHRLHSEAAFAHLCGAAPIPASSGRTDRHRLNRAGDRQANRALYAVVLTRLRIDPNTKAYRDRRTKDGLSTKEIIRCLKRYVARELYQVLTTA
jgi:transposase